MVINHPCCHLTAYLKRKKNILFSNKAKLWYLKLAECCAGIQNYEGIIYYISDYTVWMPVNFKGSKTTTLRNQLKTNVSLIDLIYTPKVLLLTSFHFKTNDYSLTKFCRDMRLLKLKNCKQFAAHYSLCEGNIIKVNIFTRILQKTQSTIHRLEQTKNHFWH